MVTGEALNLETAIAQLSDLRREFDAIEAATVNAKQKLSAVIGQLESISAPMPLVDLSDPELVETCDTAINVTSLAGTLHPLVAEAVEPAFEAEESAGIYIPTAQAEDHYDPSAFEASAEEVSEQSEATDLHDEPVFGSMVSEDNVPGALDLTGDDTLDQDDAAPIILESDAADADIESLDTIVAEADLTDEPEALMSDVDGAAFIADVSCDAETSDDVIEDAELKFEPSVGPSAEADALDLCAVSEANTSADDAELFSSLKADVDAEPTHEPAAEANDADADIIDFEVAPEQSVMILPETETETETDDAEPQAVTTQADTDSTERTDDADLVSESTATPEPELELELELELPEASPSDDVVAAVVASIGSADDDAVPASDFVLNVSVDLKPDEDCQGSMHQPIAFDAEAAAEDFVIKTDRAVDLVENTGEANADADAPTQASDDADDDKKTGIKIVAIDIEEQDEIENATAAAADADSTTPEAKSADEDATVVPFPTSQEKAVTTPRKPRKRRAVAAFTGIAASVAACAFALQMPEFQNLRDLPEVEQILQRLSELQRYWA